MRDIRCTDYLGKLCTIYLFNDHLWNFLWIRWQMVLSNFSGAVICQFWDEVSPQIPNYPIVFYSAIWWQSCLSFSQMPQSLNFKGINLILEVEQIVSIHSRFHPLDRSSTRRAIVVSESGSLAMTSLSKISWRVKASFTISSTKVCNKNFTTFSPDVYGTPDIKK